MNYVNLSVLFLAVSVPVLFSVVLGVIAVGLAVFLIFVLVQKNKDQKKIGNAKEQVEKLRESAAKNGEIIKL